MVRECTFHLWVEQVVIVSVEKCDTQRFHAHPCIFSYGFVEVATAEEDDVVGMIGLKLMPHFDDSALLVCPLGCIVIVFVNPCGKLFLMSSGEIDKELVDVVVVGAELFKKVFCHDSFTCPTVTDKLVRLWKIIGEVNVVANRIDCG